MRRILVLVLLATAVAWGDYYDVVTGQANGVSYYTSALAGAALLDTVGSFDGTITGCDQLSTTPIVGEYMQYIRTSADEVSAGRQTAWEGATAMTWSFWLRFANGVMTDGSNNFAVIGKGSGATNFMGIVKTFASGAHKLRTFVKSNTNLADIALTGCTDSTWYHFGVVYNGSAAAADRVKVYLNAAPKATTVTGTIETALENSTSAVSIGHLSWLSTFNFDGDIDEVAVWNRALDSSEIAAQYNATQLGFTLSTAYPTRTVLQRDSAATSKVITINGGYTGAVDSIQVAIWDSAADTARVAWTLLDGALSGGTYSGTLSVPWGGWYLLKSRGYSEGAPFDTVTATGKWGVGVRYGIFGQSNVGYVVTTYETANDRVSMFDTSDTYKLLADPIGYAGGGTGTWGASMAPACGNAFTDSTGIPICFVPYALPSTGLYNSVWDSAGSAFNAAEARMDSIGAMEGEILIQGETDAYNGVTGANYYIGQSRYANKRMIDHGDDYHIILVQMGRRKAGYGPTETHAVHSGIRAAKMHVAADKTNVYIGPNGIWAQEDGGGAHWTKASQDTLGLQTALAIRHRLGLADYYRGPRVASAWFNSGDSTEAKVTFTHSGTTLAPADSVRGFYGHKVSDNSWVEATGQTLTSNVLRLSFDVAVDSIYPMHGYNPTATALGGAVTTIIRDDTPFKLPLETTDGGVALVYTTIDTLLNRYAKTGDTLTWVFTRAPDSSANIRLAINSINMYIARFSNDTGKTIVPAGAPGGWYTVPRLFIVSGTDTTAIDTSAVPFYLQKVAGINQTTNHRNRAFDGFRSRRGRL